MTSGSDPGLKDVESQGHGKWGEVLSCSQHETEVWCPESLHCPGAAAFHPESDLSLTHLPTWGLCFRGCCPLWGDSTTWTRLKFTLLDSHLSCERVCSRVPCLQGQLPGTVVSRKVVTELGHTEGDIGLPERASSTLLGSRHGVNPPSQEQ